MKNTYELEVRTQCPVVPGETDIYQVTIESEHMIQVEKIIDVFDSYKTTRIFQEALTLQAATQIGARVTTVGIHSRVRVTSVAP